MKTCPKCGTEYPDTTTLCPADGLVLEKTDDSLLGQTLAEKYRIDEAISEGGMGTVYLAEDTKLHRRVSLKFLSANFSRDQERLRRFEQEARAISALNHPNTLTIHEISETDGRRFLLMKSAEQKGPTSLQVVLNWTRELKK